jgi:hypothetical protein
VNRRRFLTAAAGLSLAGCGGGGGNQYIGAPPAAYRPGILFGYYGDDAQQADETGDHANLYMSAPWFGGAPAAIANIAKAKAAGFRELIVAPQVQIPDGRGGERWGTVEQTLDLLNAYMAQLQAAGALDGIHLAGIYWCDEPNRAAELTEEYVRAVNSGLRGLTTAPIWTTYSSDAGRPGLEAGSDPRGAFDVVSVDNYDIGCNVFGGGGPLEDLKRRMKPGAKRFLIPGPVGGHVSQADPGCFENYAYANADIVAIVTFIWINGWVLPTNLGLRGLEALRTTYRALGTRVTAKP